MKTRPTSELNWLQDCDGLGMLVRDRQAQIRQDKRAASLQYASPASRNPRFTWQSVLAFASTIAVMVGIVALRGLG